MKQSTDFAETYGRLARDGLNEETTLPGGAEVVLFQQAP